MALTTTIWTARFRFRRQLIVYDLTKILTAGRAFELVRTLESDLYQNALIPVILAHEYASISLVPGGKVLDLATARAVGAV
jgi:hypothetical protein